MSQSKGVITTGQQLAYLAQWFAEMSELQTQDFMKCLLTQYGKSGHQLDGLLVNGFAKLGMSGTACPHSTSDLFLPTVGVSDRPASIFQCRMKLFNEWFGQWSDEEKQELLTRLRNVNSKFMDQFQESLDSGPVANGCAITDDDYSQTLNVNIDDDSKTSEQLVHNGVNTDHSPQPAEESPEEVAKVAEEVEEEEAKPDELTIETKDVVVVSVVDVVEETEEALPEEKVTKSDDLIVATESVGSDLDQSDLQEVVG